MDIELAITDAEQRLAALQDEMNALQDEVERTTAELTGLRIAQSRHHGTPEPTDDGGWVEMKRTDAITRALQEFDRPVAPSELAALLRDHGRSQDENYLVSASLAHLQKAGRAENLGRGQWVAPDGEGGQETMEEA